MPTFVTISPKGGAGKTTSSLVLALILARTASVALLDADPNHMLTDWAKGPNCPTNLTVIGDVDEDNILDKIEEAATTHTFVIVDLEGTAAKIVVLAVGQADFVIIPTQGSQMDAKQAARAIRVVRQHEATLRRQVPSYKLPYSVLLTRTNALITSRTVKHIEAAFKEGGVPVFQTQLHEREAYKALFVFNQPLDKLDPKEVPNIGKAIENAEQFAAELIQTYRNTLTEQT